MRQPAKVDELKRHLRQGVVYRRSELAKWPRSVDRHLGELTKAGVLRADDQPDIQARIVAKVEKVDKRKLSLALSKYGNARAKRILTPLLQKTNVTDRSQTVAA